LSPRHMAEMAGFDGETVMAASHVPFYSVAVNDCLTLASVLRGPCDCRDLRLRA